MSTIFIPLTFLVGVYGMNFTYMPEINNPYAYPIIWIIMILIALGMLLYFKAKKWL
jgi:magnesium transporter